MKNSKGVVEGEGVPLTEDLISQIYQLIDFLSLEPSKIPFSLNLFWNSLNSHFIVKK